VGKTYILRETIAPDGYVLATDVEFTVNEDGTVTEVVMKDDTTKVRISKIDITNDEELLGASLVIIDEDENIIDEWVSGEEPHFIEGRLIAGKTYILRETIAPDGYVLATDVEFTVNEDGTVTEVIMKDDTTKVKISKIDITNDEELPGASLVIIDEDENIIDEWISDKEPHFIDGRLITGKTYILREISAPDGYVIAEEIEFTVNEDGTVTEVVMKDDTTKVKISKQDMTTGKELPGAKLQVIDKDKNVMDEWISDEEPHFIEGKLTAGKTYILREITAPDGYEIANDVEFTVSEDGSVTEVVMKDKKTPDIPTTPVVPTTPTVPTPTPSVSTPTPVTSTPATGDPGKNPVAVTMCIAGLCGLVLTIVMLRKKEQK
ncbi:MAG: Cna B domain protein, partial [Oscillospiraceae bacterium]|nr:Cna B domain protein [Oscillospiraceae bacterium]